MSSPLRKASPWMAPRPAATTLVLRDGADGLEVLMVRRSLQASFMPGAYVFPGGAVDDADGDAAALSLLDEPVHRLTARMGAAAGVGGAIAAYAVAALRECFEECGLWLGAPPDAAARLPDLRRRLHGGTALAEVARAGSLSLHTAALHPWSHWVTPVGAPKRFDTLFFVCAAPAGQVPEVDAGETTTLAWVRPEPALHAHRDGGFPMEFATVATVRSLAPFGARPLAELLAHAAAQPALPALHPRLRLDEQGHILGVLMPGEPGYEQLAGDG
ncbi:MAG: hypothetical protein U1F56_17970 [Rubrivivax sp.]